jgi:hypothetical protein
MNVSVTCNKIAELKPLARIWSAHSLARRQVDPTHDGSDGVTRLQDGTLVDAKGSITLPDGALLDAKPARHMAKLRKSQGPSPHNTPSSARGTTRKNRDSSCAQVAAKRPLGGGGLKWWHALQPKACFPPAD